jgi:hypothetical protein
MPVEIVPAALVKLRDAVVPGGWLVFSSFGSPPDPLARALLDLKVARHGARSWTEIAAEHQLRSLGFDQVGTCPSDGTSTLVIGRKPMG